MEQNRDLSREESSGEDARPAWWHHRCETRSYDRRADVSYKVNLPPDIPAKLFWSVTLYEAENASGLDNGQPFPSLGKLNEPATNDDGSTDLFIGPEAPSGKESNWLATVPGRGFFAILRLYLPTEAAIDLSWKPGDIEKVG